MNKNKKEIFARIGIATKGLFYCLIGLLTTMAAIGMSNSEDTGTKGSLEFLSDNLLGKIILIAAAAGLACYVFWKWMQAFSDSDDKGDDAKGLAKRTGYFLSGLFYALIAFTAVQLVIGASSGGGDKSYVAMLLSKPFGKFLVAGLALIYFGRAAYMIYIAYSGKFKEKIDHAGLDSKVQKTILITGKIGYTARGIVIGILAFLTTKAAIYSSSGQTGGTDKAFEFLKGEFGIIVLLVIAVGLFSYGGFLLLKSLYRNLNMD